MTSPQVLRLEARDGQELAYREAGAGRPLILLHGFAASGSLWLGAARPPASRRPGRFCSKHHGPAAALARLGFRVILPDLRGHGDSARPHDPARYPPDVLADDALALIDHLGLRDYDLGGYSLGGQIVLRLLTRGARPARAVVAGLGLSALHGATPAGQNRRVLTALAAGDPLGPGSPDARAAYWFTQLGADPLALLPVLDSLVATPEAALGQVDVPTLVVVGDQDHDHAGADALAALLPRSRFATVPGDHWTAFAHPDLAAAITTFLAEPPS